MTEALEARCLLSATDISVVTFWDGETSGPSDALLNRLGGNPGPAEDASLAYDTNTVRTGNGAFRIKTDGSIEANGFGYVSTAFTGTGPTDSYIDTRDITNFEQLTVWLKNETSAEFRLVFEFKDYRVANEHRARFPVDISAGNSWTEIPVPLDLEASGWIIDGNPDFSRAKLLSFVIEATTSAVNGSIFLDDLTLTERGGVLDPQTGDFNTILERIGERQFRGLWGSRDRDTGLVPINSAFADVMALNSTAGLIQVLPAAMSQGWVGQTDADAFVDQIVSTLDQMMDNVAATGNGGFLPPRYVDRVTLLPNYFQEESPVDAAFAFLALYQHQHLATTSPPLSTKIDALLDRFDFAAFVSRTGWKLAYEYATQSFSDGSYDGYSTEIYVMSLAAHLADNNSVPIESLWNSGRNRMLASLANSAESHLVHSQEAFRAPFAQWLFHMFADVRERGDDTYPDTERRRNPYWNAVLYQRDVMRQLESLGRPTFAQPDAADDGSGGSDSERSYEQFSLYNSFGQSDLFMPWSATFGLHAELPSTEAAIRDLLGRDLHGPLGISDSVVWETGSGTFSRLPARHDFWNVALSTMAIANFLSGQNTEFSRLTEVTDALDTVMPGPTFTQPVPQALLESRSWVTFTPTNYNPDISQFPSEASLRSDLQRLYDTGFRGLITYTMDGTLREVPRIAKEVGFERVIAGVFWFDAAQLERERTAVIEELAEDSANIDGLVIGNEGLFAGRYTRAELETELQWFSNNTGKPVTTTETGGQYINDQTLMDLGDWVFPNIQPFCAGVHAIDQAVLHTANEFTAIQTIADQRISGRIAAVKEAWWPTSDHAAATEENQWQFLRDLAETQTVFAYGESFDQTWKFEANCFNQGPHWGLMEEDQSWKATVPRLQTEFTDTFTTSMEFTIDRTGRVTDHIDVTGTSPVSQVHLELRDDGGNLLAPVFGANRVSFAGHPAGTYAVSINSASADFTTGPEFNVSTGEPPFAALDLDCNGRIEFATDGIILLAYSFGTRGSDLEAFAAADATKDGAEIQAWIEQLSNAVDFDGNGRFQFANDGIAWLAHAFGSGGDDLLAFANVTWTQDGNGIGNRIDQLSTRVSARAQSPDTFSFAFVTFAESKPIAERDSNAVELSLAMVIGLDASRHVDASQLDESNARQFLGQPIGNSVSDDAKEQAEEFVAILDALMSDLAS